MNPLALFSSIKSAAITIGVIALLTLIGTLWVQKGLAEREVASLTVQKAKLESKVLSQQLEVNGLKAALTIAQETVSELNRGKASQDLINKEIDNAPASDDGPVAPVLRRTLDTIGGVHDDN